MSIPNEFRAFARGFHQDSDRIYAGAADLLSAVVAGVPLSDRRTVADFIDELLVRGPEACETAWEESPTSLLFFSAEELMTVLADCRDRLRLSSESRR
jgi:hypothetical protein